MTIIDYSTSRFTAASLKNHGVTAVGRYIGWDSVPGFASIGKNISKAEAEDLIKGGIDIFLAFEYDPNAPAKGNAQGTRDGQLAQKQLADLGAPENMGVFFAVDFDMPDYAPALSDTPANAIQKLGPVGLYFRAIRALHAKYEVCAYGGYWAIKRLFDAGLIDIGWQTVAWSGGNIDKRTALLQQVGQPLPGADPDVREHAQVIPYWGTWMQAAAKQKTPAPPPPAPTPTPKPAPTLADARAAVATLNAFLAAQKG